MRSLPHGGAVVEEIAAERNDIKVCKVNVDEQPELAGQFGVMSIPTLVVVKDGKIVRQSVGGQAQERDSWRCFEPPGRRAHGRGGMDMAQERKKRRGSRFAGGMRGLRMLREGLSRRGIGGVPRPLCQRQRRPVRGMRQVCRGMPGVGNRNAGGNGVKKKWYDALWIASLAYLALGFFNILFAWLGLLCFFIPLFIAVAKGTKGYCNRYCGRGQLLSLLGGRLGPFPQEGHSALDEEQGVSLRFLVFFFVMFFQMLWNTYLVFAGRAGPGTGGDAAMDVQGPVAMGLPRHGVPCGRCAVRLWLLRRDAYLHRAGTDHDGAVQAPQLVRVLPHGHDDAADLQGKKRQAVQGGIALKRRTIPAVVLLALMLTGCASPAPRAGGYRQVAMEEAVELMEREENYVILDVRTEQEYAAGHIPGAVVIPNESIGTEEIAQLEDKDQLILVYCRSGNRSKQAAEKLAQLGYTNIVEFGGINSWPGDIVTE